VSKNHEEKKSESSLKQKGGRGSEELGELKGRLNFLTGAERDNKAPKREGWSIVNPSEGNDRRSGRVHKGLRR